MLCLNDGQVLKYCAIMNTPHHTTWPYQTWLTTAFTEWNALLTILALGYDRLVQCHFKHKRTCSCHFPSEWTTKCMKQLCTLLFCRFGTLSNQSTYGTLQVQFLSQLCLLCTGLTHQSIK